MLVFPLIFDICWHILVCVFSLQIPLHSCITPGGWMVAEYDVIFTVGMDKNSHSLQSSRELVQITKVSVQICTPQVIRTCFWPNFENKISFFKITLDIIKVIKKFFHIHSQKPEIEFWGGINCPNSKKCHLNLDRFWYNLDRNQCILDRNWYIWTGSGVALTDFLLFFIAVSNKAAILVSS